MRFYVSTQVQLMVAVIIGMLLALALLVFFAIRFFAEMLEESGHAGLTCRNCKSKSLHSSWKKGRCGTMTHDYKRHGTTTLFAGMNVADGTVISTFMPTHNHKDWIRFLTLIQNKTPKDKDIHLILDNYGAHKTPEVRAWLAKHQRFHLHFTPTSSSWLNQVERFFRDLTDKCVRRGVFHNVKELEQSIQHYIDEHNRNPKPYLWTAKANDILEKVKRGWDVLKARGYDKAMRALDSIERCLSAHAEPPLACPPDRSAVPA